MRTKECFKCGAVLPLAEFYKHPQTADGHLGKCKECTKRDVRKNYRVKREYYSEYERERNRLLKRRAAKKVYGMRYKARHPHKGEARRTVRNAVKAGRLEREPCLFCGDENSQAHHHNYHQPFDITWVCFKCHREKFHGQVVTVDAWSTQPGGAT